MITPTKDVIAIACDHAGFDLKQVLAIYLADTGYDILDLGTDSTESVDYPDFANALAGVIRDGKALKGVLVCGSGIGVSIAANRHPEVRAALIYDSVGAKLSRLHNDANVIAFGARLICQGDALDCLNIFLNTEFEGGRHIRRINKLATGSST